MPLRVSFNLDDADLQHFEQVAQQTQALARQQSPEQIVAAAREVFDKAAQAQLADFVKERYARLGTMLEMIDDADWQSSDPDRQRLLNALACFSSPQGGLLDHAIMIELVSRDLQHDIEAYRDFAAFRAAQLRKRSAPPGSDREQWLRQRREALQARMHSRRKRDLEAAGSSVRKFFSLFGL